MKVRVAYTVTVSDDYRRAIRRYFGETGLATHAEIVQWCKTFGESEDDNLAAWYGSRRTGRDRGLQRT